MKTFKYWAILSFFVAIALSGFVVVQLYASTTDGYDPRMGLKEGK